MNTNHATDWHRFARYHGARGALLPTAINKCMPDTYIVYTWVYNTIQYYTTAESNLWPASWLPPWCQDVSQIPCLWPGGWCLLSLPCKSHRGYRESSQKNNFQSRNQSFYDLWFYDVLCRFQSFSKLDFGVLYIDRVQNMLFTFAHHCLKCLWGRWFCGLLQQLYSILDSSKGHAALCQSPQSDEKLDPFWQVLAQRADGLYDLDCKTGVGGLGCFQ